MSQETTSGEATDSPKADSGRSASQANLSVLYCPFSDATPSVPSSFAVQLRPVGAVMIKLLPPAAFARQAQRSIDACSAARGTFSRTYSSRIARAALYLAMATGLALLVFHLGVTCPLEGVF